MPKLPKMSKVRGHCQSYLLFPMVVNIASNSLHSSYSGLIFSHVNHPVSIITSNQYCVSLASLSQILILFLKSARFLDRFASP